MICISRRVYGLLRASAVFGVVSLLHYGNLSIPYQDRCATTATTATNGANRQAKIKKWIIKVDSSPTSQIADKLPNPNRCERVKHTQPTAAIND